MYIDNALIDDIASECLMEMQVASINTEVNASTSHTGRNGRCFSTISCTLLYFFCVHQSSHSMILMCCLAAPSH